MLSMLHIQPSLEQIRGGLFPKYKLLENYTYWFSHGIDSAAFDIPDGFEYDGATLGSFLFWRRPVHTSRHTLAHDYAYSVCGDVEAMCNMEQFSLTKQRVDELFLQGIRREINVPDWKALIASVAIKSIGAFYWYGRKFFSIRDKE
jgi:hypothetical protein